MSHIVTIEAKILSRTAAVAACRKLNLAPPVDGTFQMYGSSCTGLGINLTGWQYPVVADLATGKIDYDNYGGRWGDQDHLDRFLQRYQVEAARETAENLGYTAEETLLSDGSISLEVHVLEYA